MDRYVVLCDCDPAGQVPRRPGDDQGPDEHRRPGRSVVAGIPARIFRSAAHRRVEDEADDVQEIPEPHYPSRDGES